MASRGNSLIDRRLRRKHEEEYQKRIKNTKPKLDLTPPRNLTLNIQLNRIHVEQERQSAIDKQNLAILERLTKIKNKPARVDHINKSWKPSNDRLKKFRERRERRIELENQSLAERLQNVESYYSVEEWEKDYKKHMYYLSMIENTTKDYDSVEYEDDDFENELSEEESDKESLPPAVPPGTPSPHGDNKKKSNEKVDKEDVSLPPIGEKGMTSDQGKESAEKSNAEEVHTAIEESNKDNILEILGRTSEKEEMEKLCGKYKEMYEKDLLDDLDSKVDEDVKTLLVSMLSDSSPGAEDAKRLNEAVKGLGTDEDTIIEILCTRNNKQLAEIREEYQKQFEKSLEEDLRGDTSSDVEKLLVELSKGQREESSKVDEKVAKKDAETLVEAGIGNWGTNEDDFIRVFTLRSLPQLAAMYHEYSKLAKMDIAESIDKEMDGDLQKTFLAIVKHSRDPSRAQADKLSRLMEEGDTAAIAKIILPINKAQLSDLCASYKKSNKRELADDVEKKCKGDLKQMLLFKLGKQENKKKEKDKKDKEKHKDTDKQSSVRRNPQKKKKDEKKGKDGQQQKANQTKEKEPSKEKNKSQSKSSPATKQADAAVKGKKDNEASALRKAIEADDKKKIKEIIVQHASDQAKLKKLADNYKKENKKDLLEAIDSKLDDDLHEAVAAILLPPSQSDARTLYLAMKGVGTDEALLIEILCTKSNSEIEAIKTDYNKLYERSLENAVKSDTSGDFEDLLVALLQGKRDESTEVNEDQAHKDAETLIEAGIKKWGTDESSFIEIFTTRSITQLQSMFTEYAKWAKCDIEETIESEMDGDLQDGFLTMVKCVRDSMNIHVSKLHSALQEGDTATVARIIAGKKQAALKDLETTYNSQHKPKLYFEVEKRCSPELRKILLPKLKDKSQEKTAKKTHKAEAKKQTKETKKKNEDDLSKLHNAIEKNDKKSIKEVILRNATDKSKLKQLSEDYEKQNKAVMIEQLDSKIDEDILEAVTALVLSPAENDARTLFYAMKGVGTKETQLIEILCTRNNQEIKNITEEYRKKYGRSLEEDIKGDTSGDFERLLAELLKGKRDESTKVDDDSARKDASALHEAGVKKLGTDEDTFIDILTTKSNAHLQAVMIEYENLAGVKLQESIQEEMDGDLRDGLVILLSCIQDDSKTQADRLHTALQESETSTVSRIIAGTEKDKMKAIEDTYNNLYDPKLYFEVDKKCSEDLKKIILDKVKDKSTKKKETQNSASKTKNDAAEKPADDTKPSGENNETASVEKSTKEDQQGQDKDGGEEQRPKITITKVDYHGTVVASKDFNAEEEADKLKAAMKGFGSDEETIIEVLASCSSAQRQEIVTSFKQKYDKDLLEELKSELTGKFEDTIVGLLSTAADYDVVSLNDAMEGLGTEEGVLTEIICSRSSEELQDINAAYKAKFDKDLVEAVKDETSGDLCDLLTALLQAKRPSNENIDEDAAYGDAQKLYEAGEKKWGTDESMFVNILTTRSAEQLKAIFQAYKHVSKKDILESVDDELEGDFQKAVKTLVMCLTNPPEQFAESLHEALTGVITSKPTIARIITTRCEIDLVEIKKTYQEKYGKSLVDDVKEGLKGDQETLLLKLLGD